MSRNRSFWLSEALPLTALAVVLVILVFLAQYAVGLPEEPSKEETSYADPGTDAKEEGYAASLWEPIPEIRQSAASASFSPPSAGEEETEHTAAAREEEKISEAGEEKSGLPPYPGETAELMEEYARLRRACPDFRAVLRIPALSLLEPVVQGEDNETYLERSAEGEISAAGAVFLDAGANSLEDPHFFLFGHNMRSGAIFGGLRRYLSEPELLAGEWDAELWTGDRVLCLQVVSVYITDSQDARTYCYAYGKEERRIYLEEALSRDAASAAGAFAWEEEDSVPQVVTFSTCHDLGFGEMLAVQAVPVAEFRTAGQ